MLPESQMLYQENRTRLQVIGNRKGIELVNFTTLIYPAASICYAAADASTEGEAGIYKVCKQQEVQDSGLS